MRGTVTRQQRERMKVVDTSRCRSVAQYLSGVPLHACHVLLVSWRSTDCLRLSLDSSRDTLEPFGNGA